MSRSFSQHGVCLLVLVLSWLQMTPSQAQTPRVVVSVKPIHALVSGVMQGVAEPELLVTGAQSPHTFTLRPSDVRQLSAADLIVWVGSDFETFLTRTLSSLPPHIETLELMPQQGIAKLPVRRGGVWGNEDVHVHPHYKVEGAKQAQGEAGPRNDPHIWLSPQNAREIVTLMKQTLSEIDPYHAKQYQQNARSMKTRLNDLDQELLNRLSKVQWVPYIVFHDAYQFFERHYRLNCVGSITLDPERSPGARRIHEIHAKLEAQEVQCIFSEPQFEPKLLSTLTQGTDVRTGVLDPLGADLPAGTEAYFSLMRNLTDSLVQCLEASP